MRMSIAPTACRHSKQSHPSNTTIIYFHWGSTCRGSKLMEDHAHAKKRVPQLARPPDKRGAI